ncbi:MAG TPA: GntG family PLP-dependent aldolase [Sporichthya sp.]|nr:GntG family PLP-dependent aldolase [Sporichthya sp.]
MIDLRSDTVTRPTPGMRAALADAEVGDDVYGEDPTVLALQERVAGMLGHEAALFTPTGSMANQLGLRLLAHPGEEVLCDSQAHVVRAELGAHAAFGAVTTRTWNAPEGLFAAADVIAMAVPESSTHLVRTGVVAVENTHNFGGGTVQPLEELKVLRKWASDSTVRLHLDGARLWNAHVATGTSLQTYGELFDTVSVCLSKGLGAPIGSLIAGSADLVTGARWWRKRLGGGMRQVGVLAAAGLYALDHHVERLAEDHARAAELARRLSEVTAGVSKPETNIVVLDLPEGGPVAAEVTTSARDEGVLVSLIGPRTIRLVTHLDVDDAGCARAADVLCKLLS